MLHGFLLPAPRLSGPLPMLRARLTLQPLPGDTARYVGAVDFLIDTGSDFTVLHPTDASEIGIPVATYDFTNAPTNRFSSPGSAGLLHVSSPGTFSFDDDVAGTLPLPGRVWIAQPLGVPNQSGSWVLPSILGRDILGFFEFTLNYTTDPAVRLEPLF